MKVCVIGGSGIKSTISALKRENSMELYCIVSVFDSGGSTGVLRRSLGVHAMGDLRDVLFSASENDELTDMLKERIEVGGTKHSLGNFLLITFMHKYGEDYLKHLSDKLSIPKNIHIIPIVKDINYTGNMYIDTEHGRLIGEHNLDTEENININSIGLDKRAALNPEAEEAISKSDYVLFGPGDLYSSILVNSLVDGFVDTVSRSKAKKILITNIMNKTSETMDFKSSDFIRSFEKYGISIDASVINTKITETDNINLKYGKVSGFVRNDIYNDKAILADLINERVPFEHDPEKLRDTLLKILV